MDVDVNTAIHVRRGVVRSKSAGVVEKAPKIEAGIRDVPIPPHILDAVVDHKKQHGAPGLHGRCFPGATGGHLSPSAFYGKVSRTRRSKPDTRGWGWYEARCLAGREDLRFPHLRHEALIEAARHGVTLAELMALGGHSTSHAAMRYAIDVDTSAAPGAWCQRTSEVFADVAAQEGGDGVPIELGTTYADVRYAIKAKTASKLTVAKSPYGASGWRFGSRLTRAGKAYRGRRVELWIRIQGTWLDYEQPKRTNRQGRVSWHTRPDLPKAPARYAFQFRFTGDKTTKPARSAVFNLNPR